MPSVVVRLGERESRGLTWWCVELELTKHLNGRTEVVQSRAWVGDRSRAKWLAEALESSPDHPALKGIQWLAMNAEPSSAACAARVVELNERLAPVTPITGVVEVCS